MRLLLAAASVLFFVQIVLVAINLGDDQALSHLGWAFGCWLLVLWSYFYVRRDQT